MIAGVWPANIELGFALGRLCDAQNSLSGGRFQEWAEPIAADRHQMGSEDKLQGGVIPLRIDKPKPGQH